MSGSILRQTPVATIPETVDPDMRQCLSALRAACGTAVEIQTNKGRRGVLVYNEDTQKIEITVSGVTVEVG